MWKVPTIIRIPASRAAHTTSSASQIGAYATSTGCSRNVRESLQALRTNPVVHLIEKGANRRQAFLIPIVPPAEAELRFTFPADVPASSVSGSAGPFPDANSTNSAPRKLGYGPRGSPK